MFLVKVCNRKLGCIRHPMGCSPTKGNCKAYALSELMMLENKTMLRFELSLLSYKKNKDAYVGIILSKQRHLSSNSNEVMIVCHKNGVSII
jgi:hypothetical protein